MQQKGILNGFVLKMIMAVLMLLDHIYVYLPPQPVWFHQVSRVVAPLFAFFVAQGMVYTRNRSAYILRILGFGAAMYAGNTLLNLLFGPPLLQNSILISLGIAAAFIACMDNLAAGDNRWVWALCGLFLLWAAIFFEGAHLCLIMCLLFYYLRARPVLMCAAYVAVMPVYLWLVGFSRDQYLMVFAVVPILLYNGKRGPGGAFAKYFFYVFYPLHIWVLFLIAQGIW